MAISAIRFGMASACLAAVLAGSAGLAQDVDRYGNRMGMPEVAVAPRPVDPQTGNRIAAGNFQRWYAAKGRPTILVFWNRELSEEGVSRYSLQAKSSGSGSVSGNSYSYEKSSELGVKRESGGLATDLTGVSMQRVEGAFMSEFLRAGGRLLDRNALMRKLSTRVGAQTRDDVQYLETLALQQGVTYLVEIVPNETSNGTTDLAMSVKIKHLPSSALVGQFVSSATPPSGPTHYEARGNRYVAVKDINITPETIGRQLATDVMRELAR